MELWKFKNFEIYEEEEKKGTGRGRGVRAATVRALDDRILGDDHNLFEV